MKVTSAQEAMKLAIEIAGSDDFGPAGLEEGLERILEAIGGLPLRPAALKKITGGIVLDLTQRLRIEQWYKDHPAAEAVEIEGPVLVCGLPRTGTTATVAMLALDPKFRFPRIWEMTQPVPPPCLAEEYSDPRAVSAREGAKLTHMSQHISDPDGPEEDMFGIAPLNMRSYHGALPMPDDFLDWWIKDDFASTYAYHRRVLKLLQSRRPPHLWLLKAPLHLFKLEAFATEYPNARFIWTHRDPASVIPSVSSLQYTLHSEHCVEGSLDKLAVGRRALAFWAEGVSRGLAARKRIGEDRFIDVWNRDVAERPRETFAALYIKLGYDFSPQLEWAIDGYVRRNALGAHGEHSYTAEEYGLTRDLIRGAFAEYAERFSV